MIVNHEVMGRKLNELMGLTVIQDALEHEMLQIFVIRSDFDSENFFKIMLSLFKVSYNNQKLFIIN